MKIDPLLKKGGKEVEFTKALSHEFQHGGEEKM